MKLATILPFLPLFFFALGSKGQDMIPGDLFEQGKNFLRQGGEVKIPTQSSGTLTGSFDFITYEDRFGDENCFQNNQLSYSSMSCQFTITAFSGNTATLYMRNSLEPTTSNFDCSASGTSAGDVLSCSLSSTTDVAMYWLIATDGTLDIPSGTYSCDYQVSGSNECFSGESMVDIFGRGATPMKDLQVGDKILVGKSYEMVYEFAHLEATKSTEFLQIFTDRSEDEHGPLEITGDHFMKINNEFLPAHSVQIGDTLSSREGNVVVTKVNRLKRKGMYAPLTPSGALLVNGVEVSSYAWTPESGDLWLAVSSWLPVSYHTASHMAFSPLRMACLGVSSRFCMNDFSHENNKGHPPFVDFSLKVVKQQNVVALAFLFVLTCGPVYLLELIFGASVAPLAIASLVGIWGVVKLSRKRGWLVSPSKDLCTD